LSIQIVDPAPGAYRPGACNIGPHEIAKRRATGFVGVAIAAVLAVVLLAIDAAPIARTVVFVPLWVATSGFEQARRRFCAGFAFAGIRSVADSDDTEAVGDREDLAADRTAARILVAYCGAIALALTALFVLLPA
jgi:hypothetical protein